MQPCDVLNVKNVCAPQQRLSADRLLCSANHTGALAVAAPSHTALTAVLTVSVTARIFRPKGDGRRVLRRNMMMMMVGVVVVMRQEI